MANIAVSLEDMDDPTFLEAMAASLDNVKVKPKGDTASQIQAAHAGTAQFRARADRLRKIAARLHDIRREAGGP